MTEHYRSSSHDPARGCGCMLLILLLLAGGALFALGAWIVLRLLGAV